MSQTMVAPSSTHRKMTDTTTAFDAFTAALDPQLSDEVVSLKHAGADEVFAYAMSTALRDFMTATSASGVGEEHRTAALMGFIGTSLGVFSLLARLSGVEGETRLLWHAANRRSSKLAGKGESETGGDFGIAVPSPSPGSDLVRLSFFQAKNRSDNGRIDLRRQSRGSGLSETEEHNSNARVLRWLGDGPPANVSAAHDHQIYKLAVTQEHGRAAAQNDLGRDWVHYVIWSGGDPVQISLEQVRSALARATLQPGPQNAFVGWLGKADQLKIPPVEFTKHLARALTPAHAGWIELPLEQAKNVVGQFVELGADWYTIDTEQGGVAQQLTLNHPLIDQPERIGTASHAVTSDLELMAAPHQEPEPVYRPS